MTRRRGAHVWWVVALAAACHGGADPVPVDTKNDMCSYCRMIVSDVHLAAQIIARGEEPRFFDDIGCLAGYLREHPSEGHPRVYVADHRTGQWVDADRAIFARLPQRSTPMATGLVAYASEASKTQDAAAAGATTVSRDAALGGARVEAAR